MSRTDTFLWASRLLHYPDAELETLAQDSGADRDAMPPWAAAFLEYAAATPLLDIQADFVRTFDLNPSASLYLTTHVYGDSPLQGRALAALLELYREGGCEPAARAEGGPGSGELAELPDYLPMTLEFLAVAPPWAAACLCEKFAPVAESIAAQLTAAHSPWAGMLQAAAEAMRACAPETTPVKGAPLVTDAPDSPPVSPPSSREVFV